MSITLELVRWAQFSGKMTQVIYQNGSVRSNRWVRWLHRFLRSHHPSYTNIVIIFEKRIQYFFWLQFGKFLITGHLTLYTFIFVQGYMDFMLVSITRRGGGSIMAYICRVYGQRQDFWFVRKIFSLWARVKFQMTTACHWKWKENFLLGIFGLHFVWIMGENNFTVALLSICLSRKVMTSQHTPFK